MSNSLSKALDESAISSSMLITDSSSPAANGVSAARTLSEGESFCVAKLDRERIAKLGGNILQRGEDSQIRDIICLDSHFALPREHPLSSHTVP